jgi:hypothetical protein
VASGSYLLLIFYKWGGVTKGVIMYCEIRDYKQNKLSNTNNHIVNIIQKPTTYRKVVKIM